MSSGWLAVDPVDLTGVDEASRGSGGPGASAAVVDLECAPTQVSSAWEREPRTPPPRTPPGPVGRQSSPGKRPAAVEAHMAARLGGSPYSARPRSPERAASTAASAAALAGASPAGGATGSPSQGREAAHLNDVFVRQWTAWCEGHFQKTNEFVSPELANRLLSRPLIEAMKMLADVSKPTVRSPLSLLAWMLRQAEEGTLQASSRGAGSSAAPAPAPSPARVERPGAQPSEQQAVDALRSFLPLATIDRGEAGNLPAEGLFCMSCGLRQGFRRRIVRPSGLEQPQSLHRFLDCGCGAKQSIVMYEHFAGVYLISFIMVRPPTEHGEVPMMVPSQQRRNRPDGSLDEPSEQPVVNVVRYPVS